MLTNALLDTHHGVTRYDRATFFGKIVDFGELILTKIALPGDV